MSNSRRLAASFFVDKVDSGTATPTAVGTRSGLAAKLAFPKAPTLSTTKIVLENLVKTQTPGKRPHNPTNCSTRNKTPDFREIALARAACQNGRNEGFWLRRYSGSQLFLPL